ncbi:MAG: phage major capsid protein [Bacillota bacterium]
MAEAIEKLQEEITKLTDDIMEGQKEIKEEFEEKGKTLKDVQDEVVKLDNEKSELEKELKEVKKELAEAGRLPNGEKKEEKEDFGFKNLGEFVQVSIKNSKDNPKDDRLKDVADWMEKELGTTPGEAGGFMVPPQFGDMMDVFEPQDPIFRGRALEIPAGDPPDSELIMPALDQSGEKGVYAGVAVEWIESGDEKPETDFDTRDITLKPNEVAGHMIVKDKLLRNAPGAAGLINQLLEWARIKAEDDAFLTGSGDGKPLGVLGHESNILVDRQDSDEIEYEDIVNVFSKILFGGNYIWLISQTTLPQLMTMEDTAGQLIWQPNARDGSPGSLLGIPTELNERSPALGDTGDLGLLDLMFYYIKDGSGPVIASSEHVEFLKNKTAIKIFFNVDGQPAITTPLEQENGEEVSPFVFLSEDTEA